MNPPRPKTPLLALALATSLAPIGCGDQAPPATDRLVVVDGIEIRLAEVEPYVQFLDSFIPEGGRKTKIRRVLEEQVLPLRLAQRAFASKRREQLDRALALCTVATNVAELEAQTKVFEDKTSKKVSRMQAKLPVAMFLFDELKVGSVSAPLEVPFGYIVAGCRGLETSAVALDDAADALQIGFATHPAAEWQSWIDAERKRVASLVTYVHPDYRDAMPAWLQLPRLP